MFARLFSAKRTTETTNPSATAVAKLTEINGNARFPSPSAVTEPGSVANSHTNTLPDSPLRAGSGLRTPSPSHQTVQADADAESLRELFKSCPPKIVYSYLTSQIMNASPRELQSLASFFSELQPPTRLHCVRCHKSYFEVDNDDRSCTLPHDDESAEVEHVKGGGFETRWDCCGRTVEGSGELGPPSGWCYEGRHTIDLKRARYRNDSSLADDKLASCAKKKCFAHFQPKEEKRPPPSRAGKPRSVYIPDDVRSVRSTRSTRSLKEDVVVATKPVSAVGLSTVDKNTVASTVGKKRKRASKNEAGDDEGEGEEGEGEERERKPAVKPKSRGATRAKPKPKDKEKDQMDTDDDTKSIMSVRSVRDTPAAKRRRRKSVVE